MQAPPCRSLKAKAFMPPVGTVRQRIAGPPVAIAHLLDDVGETLVEPVVGIERLGVHDADQVVAGADAATGTSRARRPAGADEEHATVRAG